mmetsp:Transcript_38441/g.82012  ORF Transcript_38441/g.82012 Transcript_38441/m.82012 type:complete len:337 (-) Transcript_38441:4192-5202(-)
MSTNQALDVARALLLTLRRSGETPELASEVVEGDAFTCDAISADLPECALNFPSVAFAFLTVTTFDNAFALAGVVLDFPADVFADTFAFTGERTFRAEATFFPAGVFADAFALVEDVLAFEASVLCDNLTLAGVRALDAEAALISNKAEADLAGFLGVFIFGLGFCLTGFCLTGRSGKSSEKSPEKSKSSSSTAAFFWAFLLVNFFFWEEAPATERELEEVELVTFTITVVGTDTGVAFNFLLVLLLLGVKLGFLDTLDDMPRLGLLLGRTDEPVLSSVVTGEVDSSNASISLDFRFFLWTLLELFPFIGTGDFARDFSFIPPSVALDFVGSGDFD